MKTIFLVTWWLVSYMHVPISPPPDDYGRASNLVYTVLNLKEVDRIKKQKEFYTFAAADSFINNYIDNNCFSKCVDFKIDTIKINIDSCSNFEQDR